VNVLFLTHAFPRAVGDLPGSFILRLAVALAREGVSATVVAPHAPGLSEHATVDGIAVRRVRYAPERYETLAYTGTMAEQVASSWIARAALVALIGRIFFGADRARRVVRPALLHAHWWFPSGLAAAAVSALRGVPLVTTLHGSDVRLARSGSVGGRLYDRVARRSSVVTAVSSWLAARARELAPEAPPAVVAPMPVAVDLFSPGSGRASDRLLFVGRLSTQKGGAMLLRALTELPQRISLDVVGDGPERDSLRALATSLGIAERVRWHPTMPQSRLVDFYRSATAVVVPSVDEGLGLVAVEAQLCGTPVVAFDSGGLRDVVTDGETGILVGNLDAAALAAALERLLARADRGASLGAAGRVRALEQFAPEAVARRYAAIYQDAINHSHDRKG
jgi:glycosyltransferase involved in cell wall biosynthesis